MARQTSDVGGTVDERDEGDQGEHTVDVNLQKERLGLAIRFTVIALLAPIIGWMLSRIYQPGSVSYMLLHELASLIPIQGHSSMALIASFVLGIVIGFLTLFTVDSRKRYQGVLLLVGTALGLATLASQGLLLVDIQLTSFWNIGMFISGVGTTLVVEYPRLKKLWEKFERVESEDLTFHRATVGVFLLFAMLVLGGLLDGAITGQWLIVPDLPASIAFIYLLFGFVQYDSTADVAVIGPRESGKSLLLLALYLTYRDRGAAQDATGYMEELVRQADEMADDAKDFPFSNTSHLEKLSFKIVTGGYFPKRIEISVTDFQGELLGNMLAPSAKSSRSVSDSLSQLRVSTKSLLGLDLDNSQKEIEFKRSLESPNVLILLLDMARVMDSDIEHITHLMSIGKQAKQNGSEIIVVATKCDLFIDEFNKNIRITDNPVDQGLEDQFEMDITQAVTKSFDTVDELVNDIGNGKIYPVYYKTETGRDGELEPALDRYGNLQYRGTDELSKAIEARL